LSDVDCLVIGAGAVGLAVARAVSATDRDVIIVERERGYGMHTSSRNSEVIHAGIHYAPNSLKAKLCRRGRDLLYEYAAERGIGHNRCGKLTLAASAEELPHLQHIEELARANEVTDLTWLDAAEVKSLEPELSCHSALFSPSTGIIDSHAYMQSLLGDAERSGASIVFDTEVTSLKRGSRGIEVSIDHSREASVRARYVVNCGGLFAAIVARRINDLPSEHIPNIHYARGNYFALPGRAPFSHLVYPAPTAAGHLGIHMTLDLSGAARFGPDLEWIESISYQVDASRRSDFVEAIARYWPGVPADSLEVGYCGIRPKLSGPGDPARDFLISTPEEHGIPGLINLFGIDSPGLTASLALAEQVAAFIDEN
jgi:L-2-hydroxyglutarate oxidase LhgO